MRWNRRNAILDNLPRWIETSDSLEERAALVVEKLKHNGYGERVQEMMDRERAARHVMATWDVR
jgi:hypothetical protein